MIVNQRYEAPVTIGLIVLMVLVSGGLGYYIGGINASQPARSAHTGVRVVNLLIVPDYGGAGYDAFVKDASVNATLPQPATNNTGPGPNGNNFTVSVGVSIKFVITSVDSAVLQNFTGQVSSPFVVYNDTESGQVGMAYDSGQTVSNLAIGHTFTISQLDLNIPIPPLTMVTFTYTFSKPGLYLYVCETPCGPGMNLNGYMQGYILVTQ